MPNILIEGGGIAGQVLHRELTLQNIPSRLVDTATFPREKVCGGTLQWDSWQYLRSIFDLEDKVKTIHATHHFWRGKLVSRIPLETPMVYVSRFSLDHSLNSRQKPLSQDSKEWVHVLATGVQRPKSAGGWLGFQSTMDPVEELQMHYGKGIYAGIAPTLEGKSHAAWVVKKEFFKNMEGLRQYIQKELKLDMRDPLKGTGAIDYNSPLSSEAAVGDAKMVTHPFLGLGMKHALLSARLMAGLIASGKMDSYSRVHRQTFRKYRLANFIGGKIYESPLRSILRPFLGNQALFLRAYRWLHQDPREIKALPNTPNACTYS